MPVINVSFFTSRKWQALLGVVVLIVLYFVFRPQPDPAQVIRTNLHQWAAQLEKSPQEATGAQTGNAQEVTATASAALLEDYGEMRRLVRAAFTEDARIQAIRGPREQGRDAITKWCLAVRSHADSLAVQLSDVVVHFDPATPLQASATLLVQVDARYQGQAHSQSYRCQLQLVREKDKKWRIEQLVAQSVRGT